MMSRVLGFRVEGRVSGFGASGFRGLAVLGLRVWSPVLKP